MFTFESYETRPAPAWVVQWDGSREMAKEIIEWAEGLDTSELSRKRSYYSERYVDGRVESTLRLDCATFDLIMQPHTWLVHYLVGDEGKIGIEVYKSDEFNKRYRKVEE